MRDCCPVGLSKLLERGVIPAKLGLLIVSSVFTCSRLNMLTTLSAEDSQRSLLREPVSWLERAVLVVALLACVLWVDGNVADPDLWGHVQFGRDALAEGLPSTTTYSYTAEGHRWINHEILAELLVALGMDMIGPTGLLICKSVSAAAMVALFFWWGRYRGNSVLALVITANVVAAGMRSGWLLRPHLLSYIYFGVMLGLLEWCFAGWH